MSTALREPTAHAYRTFDRGGWDLCFGFSDGTDGRCHVDRVTPASVKAKVLEVFRDGTARGEQRIRDISATLASMFARDRVR